MKVSLKIAICPNMGWCITQRMSSKAIPVELTQDEVLAILQGERIITRLAKPRDDRDKFIRNGGFHASFHDRSFWTFRPWDYDAPKNLDGKGDPLPFYAILSPFGKKGDVICVKEETRIWWRPMTHDSTVNYRAGNTTVTVRSQGCVRIPNGILTLGSPLREYEQVHNRWRSAKRMPLEAARLWLRIRGVSITQDLAGHWQWRVEFTKARKV